MKTRVRWSESLDQMVQIWRRSYVDKTYKLETRIYVTNSYMYEFISYFSQV